MTNHLIDALIVILSTMITLSLLNLTLMFAGTQIANFAVLGAIVCLPTVIILLDNIVHNTYTNQQEI